MSTLERIKLLKFVVFSSIFLSGCGANHYSIHQADHLYSDESTVIAVDAKQRFLLSNLKRTDTTPASQDTAGTTKTTEMIRRFCAEPSPDVFSVLSQSASGSGSFGQTADPKSINVALQAAFASSETGSTISRTQTINMLKEMMYRTCERYLNGQISDLEYPIIAARDQRIMTSILAIEQLTGAVLPKPVVIAATGSASTGQSTNDAITSLDNAKKKVDEKKDALNTAQKEFGDIDNPVGSCDTLMAKKPAEVTSDEEKTKLKSCNVKKGNLVKAEQESKDAQVHYDALVSLAGKPGSSSATTSAVLLSSPTTEIDKQIEQDRSQAIQSVADVVNSIVAMSFNREDETSFFCYSVLRQDIDSALKDKCVEFLLAKVQSETERYNLEIQKASKQMLESRKLLFEKFWDKIKKDSNLADTNKLKERIDKKFLPDSTPAPLKHKLDKMKLKTNKNDLWTIFKSIEIWAIDELVKD